MSASSRRLLRSRNQDERCHLKTRFTTFDDRRMSPHSPTLDGLPFRVEAAAPRLRFAYLSATMTFTAPDRHMTEEDRIVLTSVGVDIGSSTSHLLFSRLELERRDGRYITVKRDVLYQSDILLTPYAGATTIDGASLGAFIDRQYVAAGLARDQVDTGAL